MFTINTKIEATRRAEFTHHHLNSAKLFSNSADEIEKDYSPENISAEIKGNYISYASSSIISSFAAFEANINEKFTDFARHYSTDRKDLEKSHIAKQVLDLTVNGGDIFSKIKNQSMPALVKYKMLAILRTGEDNTPEQGDLLFISRMRNELVHFTPRWEDTRQPKKSLETSYNNNFKNKFSLSPFYAGDLMFLPYRCLSASCAKWSFAVIGKFIKDYNSLVAT